MIYTDTHLHTSFSSDSDTPMELMIKKGIELGMKTLCFTEHYDPCYPDTPDKLDFLLDFENYKKYWIIREIVLFINNKITDIKNEFKSFFKDKRENFGKVGHEHEEVEDKTEVYLTEEDLLPSIDAIDKREKLMEKLTEFSSLKNRLSSRQIEVLNYYFGFGVERRFSIFEIEEKLGIEKGKGEIIFEQALLILSTMEGKMFL